MKKQFLSLLATAFLVIASLSGCKKDSAAPENEEELITTIKLTFIETNTNNAPLVFTFKDADGPGGNAPTVNDQIVLAANKTYNCTVQVLDESKTPAEDITDEIKAESVDHQFYFTASSGLNIAVSGLDTDSKGQPLGVNSVWTTRAASGPGTVTVTLKHKPGAKGANDAITVGETDIEVAFAARVQ